MAINLNWPKDGFEFQRFMQQTGLNVELATRALYLAWYARELGGITLVIESAYRSPERNRELQRQWDAGNRAGLKTRPADSSLHMEGRAFDVGITGAPASAATWEAVGRLGEALGLRWGGRFQTPDPVHFDI